MKENVFSKKVKSNRRNCQLSQREVAKILKLDIVIWSKIENDRTDYISPEILISLNKVLEINIEFVKTIQFIGFKAHFYLDKDKNQYFYKISLIKGSSKYFDSIIDSETEAENVCDALNDTL